VPQRATIWDQLIDLVADARDRVVIVAPFIKAPTFAELIAAIPSTVPVIECVTRWSIPDVAAGVTDPEIIDLTASDERLTIHLCHMLHAKIFLSDGRALTGSANVTARATGRTAPANIEVLVEVPADHPMVKTAMEAIRSCWISATPELASSIRRQAEVFRSNSMSFPRAIGDADCTWTPITRSPERLFAVYSGRSHDYPAAVLAGVVEDLAVLDIQPGFELDGFRGAVQERLRLIPEVGTLLDRGTLTAPDLEGKLMERLHLSSDRARTAAENLASWLGFFDDYMITPAGYWEIRKGRVIG
jgi:hypothetical protein